MRRERIEEDLNVIDSEQQHRTDISTVENGLSPRRSNVSERDESEDSRERSSHTESSPEMQSNATSQSDCTSLQFDFVVTSITVSSLIALSMIGAQDCAQTLSCI